MKNPFLYLAIVFSSIFVSCNRSYNLETEDGIENVKQEIIENFGNKEITSLAIFTNSSVVPRAAPDFNSVTVAFEEDGQSYYQTWQGKLRKRIERIQFPGLNIKPEVEKSFKIGMINFEEIPLKVNIAKKMIENPEQYSYINLGNWETTMTKKSKFVHFFKLYCIFKKPSDIYQSTFSAFKIDENGNLVKVL